MLRLQLMALGGLPCDVLVRMHGGQRPASEGYHRQSQQKRKKTSLAGVVVAIFSICRGRLNGYVRGSFGAGCG